MKVSIAVKLARQVEGEYVFIEPLIAFIDKENMRNYLNGITFQPTEVIDGVPCLVEVSVLSDVEVGDIAQFFGKEG